MKNTFLRTAVAAVFILLSGTMNAQTRRPEFHFGQPAAEDFSLNAVAFDSGANAVIIADIGRSEYKNISRDNLVLL